MLAEKASAAGFRLVVFDEIGSTNEEAMARARAGDPGRLWLRAGMQTRGRGRHGRLWASPPGNLYASLLLIDPAPMRHAAQLGFVGGVALSRALADLAGADALMRIKWPNDIVRQEAKLAGISVEGSQVPGGAFAAVLGFGVNCLSHPDGLAYPTTCLAEFLDPTPRADRVLAALSEAMVDALDLWAEGRNFGELREKWLGATLPIGSRLTVNLPTGPRDGAFASIDELGRLMLKTDVGPLTVEAADVFLTARPDAAWSS